jgi:alanyl-tRNA synthetase
MALFGEKYGDAVRMISIGDYSRELCGGTHLSNTGQIGLFVIASEGSIGAGLRRIEALTGRGAERHVYEMTDLLSGLYDQLQTQDIPAKIAELNAELGAQRRQIGMLQRRMMQQDLERVLGTAREVDGVRVVAAQVEAPSRDALREMGDMVRTKIGSGVVVLVSVVDGKPAYLAMTSPDLKIHAGNLVKRVAEVAGGGGGGRPDLGQAGGGNPAKLAEALERVPQLING